MYEIREKEISENCERIILLKKKDFKAERIFTFYEDFYDRLQ